MTQEDLAKLLNCSTNTIRNWEHGRFNPSDQYYQKLKLLAERYKVDTSLLPKNGVYNVKMMRDILSLSQENFAKLINTSRINIARWEAGTRPSMKYRKRLGQLIVRIKRHQKEKGIKSHVNNPVPRYLAQIKKDLNRTSRQLATLLKIDLDEFRQWELGVLRPTHADLVNINKLLSFINRKKQEKQQKLFQEKQHKKFLRQLERIQTSLDKTNDTMNTLLEISAKRVLEWRDIENPPTFEEAKRIHDLLLYISSDQRKEDIHIWQRRHPVTNDIPELIKQTKKQLNMGTIQLAAHLCVHPGTLKMWENGRQKPGKDSLKKIFEKGEK